MIKKLSANAHSAIAAALEILQNGNKKVKHKRKKENAILVPIKVFR
jgi:hypothetical protein